MRRWSAPFLCVLLASCSTLPPFDPVEAMLGIYMSDPKDICFVTASTASGWGDCQKMRDELAISRNTDGVKAAVHVSLDSVWTNGHSCTFRGDGSIVSDRTIVAVDGSHPDCPVTFEKTADTIAVSTPEGCSSRFCGMRGGIEGTLRKVVCATPDGVRQMNEPTSDGCGAVRVTD